MYNMYTHAHIPYMYNMYIHAHIPNMYNMYNMYTHAEKKT